MKFNQILKITCIFILVINACQTKDIIAPKPINNNFIEPAKPLTTVGIPISVNLIDVANAINKKFEKNIYNDNSFENEGGDDLKISIDKRSNILVNGKENAIQIQIPMHIEGIYRFKKSVLGLEINKEQNFGFNVTAIIKSIPAVDREWNLTLKSKTQVRWEDLPVIEIAGYKLDFPDLFGNIIQSQSDKISSYIDKEVPKQVQLKKEVSNSWNDLRNPFLIDEKLNSWLILRPKEIFITPITTTESTLDFNTGISSIVETRFPQSGSLRIAINGRGTSLNSATPSIRIGQLILIFSSCSVATCAAGSFSIPILQLSHVWVNLLHVRSYFS
jgi:frataxin-like iron-binding protein CyaY